MYSQSNISRFQRKLRNDPFFGVYKHRFYFTIDQADATEIREWLEERYQRWEGHQYRIIYYASTDGNHYAHSVYMQTLSDTDLIHAKLRWNLTDLAIQRGDRIKNNRKSAKAQHAENVGVPQFSPDEAAVERALLDSEAKFSGWSSATLRAKKAWVTMRTVGWTPRSSQVAGA